MFYDDFESMLEAVCEVANSDIPRLPPQPARKPKSTRSETGISRSEKTSDHDYVPPPPKPEPTYDRSRYVMSNMKSSVTKERLSPQQAEAYVRVIKNAVTQHGNIYIDQSHYPNIGKLYPREAVEAMLLAQTKHWPGYKLDDVLESIMYKFVKEHPDPQKFAHDLGEAIRDTECMDGVLLRLNLQTIANPSVESISIKTKFGTVTQSRIPRRTAFVGDLREKMRYWLQQQGAFTPHIEVVYRGLNRIDKQYSEEQKLLSWMGYLVTHLQQVTSNPHISPRSQIVYALYRSESHLQPQAFHSYCDRNKWSQPYRCLRCVISYNETGLIHLRYDQVLVR